MNSFRRILKISLIISLLCFGVACKKDDPITPTPTPSTGFRAKIDYSLLTPTTPYKALFIDAQGDTTVDLTHGNNRLKMFQALNYYIGTAVKSSIAIDSAVMDNIYQNKSNPFVNITSLGIIGDSLNKASVQLWDKTASSRALAETDAARTRIQGLFGAMALASKSVGNTAVSGTAGKLGTYLVDAKGIEVAQIIQKSLIGALQVDYICNVLLDKGLSADNSKLVTGKKYTQLEQNWDEAYGILTKNPVYLAGYTDATKGTTTTEYFLGSYIWEYNRTNYSKFHLAFLKGRVAIVNNDITELKAQANFIRTEIEKTLATSAVEYCNKWKSSDATDATRAHAIAEGLGFIYSLRYATLSGADAKFSDDLLDGLINSPNGFWDLTNSKINSASDAITAKFKL